MFAWFYDDPLNLEYRELHYKYESCGYSIFGVHIF